jgi:ATP-dependent Clp protease protease subunit
MSNVISRLIPSVTDESDGIFRSSDIYSRLLKDRIIILQGPIEEHSATIVVMQLLFLESENAEKPIYIYINSPGGGVYSCFSILDTMLCLKCPVATVGFGFVASAASVILACGTRGLRSCLPNTRIMIHQPHGSAGGQVTDIEIQTNEMIFLKNKLIQIMADRTNVSEKDLRFKMERDNYLSAQDAFDMNLIDQIFSGSFDKKNGFSPDILLSRSKKKK